MTNPSGQSAGTLIIACGALAREVLAVIEGQGLRDIAITCLPAGWHNTPAKIPEGVRAKIQESRGRYDRILVAYGDCGTGGALDKVLREEGVERVAGAHCYEFFATPGVFAALAEAEPGTFYLSDFLLRHFDRLVIDGLGIDRHPELLAVYFANYRRLVYLAQSPVPDSEGRARAIAQRLGLEYRFQATGFGGLETSLRAVAGRLHALTWQA